MVDEDIVNTRILSVSQPRGYRGRFVQATLRIPDTDAQTADVYLTPFFIADREYEIVRVRERHDVVGGAGATVEIYVTPNGSAGGTGRLACSLDVTGAVDTNQNGTLSGTMPNLHVGDGESLTAKVTNAGTLEGINVTVYLNAL